MDRLVSQQGPSRQQLYDPRVTSTGFEDTLPSSNITPTEHHDRIQEALRYQSANDSMKSPNMPRQQSTRPEKVTVSAAGTPINFEGLDSLEVFKDFLGDKYNDGPPTNANGTQDVTSSNGLNNQTQNHDETGGTTPIETHQKPTATVELPQDHGGVLQESGTFENSCAGSSDHQPLLHVPSTETSDLPSGAQLPDQSSNNRDGAAAPIVLDDTNQSEVKSSGTPLSSANVHMLFGLKCGMLDVADDPEDSLLPALLPIGNNLEKWCPGCGHQGHSGLEFHSCPTGRLVRYIMSTGTKEYALMHKADGTLHFVNDRHHLIDGMTYLAFRLQGDKSTETIYRLKQTGAKLMRAILKVLIDPFYGQFIRPADPTQYPTRLSGKVAMHQLTASFFNLTGAGPSDELERFENWTHFNVPFVGFEDETGSEMMEITEAYSRFQEAVHASRLQGEDFNLSRPLKNINELEANLQVYIGDEYLPVQSNDEKDKKKRLTTSDPPESNRTKYRRGIDTSIYDGVETEILGGRASVRCSTCLMRGHTLTATKTCPIGMLDRALNCASARTKIQWTNLKPKADKACGQLEGVIALLENFPEEKARLRKKIAEYRELDPVTGRPRYAPIKGYALKVARKEAQKALEENPDPLANTPIAKYTPEQISEYTFPYLPGLGVKAEFLPVHWDSLWRSDIPRDIVVRSACPLEQIGDRADTHCHLCLHYGHDSRYKSCPVQIVRQIFHNPTAHGIAKARGLLDEQLRKAFYWQDAVPHGLKHDTGSIADLFQLYQDHKKSHEDKQMDLVSGRDQKRQKMLHIDPESQAETPYMCSDIFTGDGVWDSQSHTSPFAPGQNHKELHPSYHPPTPHYASSPPTHFGFSSSIGPQTPQMQATPPVSATLAPQPVDGTIIDHTKLRGDQFARIFPYVVNDGKNYGGLVVNFSAMPVQLVLELMPCVMNSPGIEA